MHRSASRVLVSDIQQKRSMFATKHLPEQRAEALNSLTIPEEWVKIECASSVTYRPKQSSLPSVKVHLTAYRVDVDQRKAGRITSETFQFTTLDELIQQTRVALEQFS